MNCSGTHLIADLYGCRDLDDADAIERLLRDVVVLIGATLVGLRLHRFGEGQGVTGVAMLAESHVSVHTWPEHGFAAVDMFVCGRDRDLDAAVALIAARLGSDRREVRVIARGGAVSGAPSRRQPE